MSEPLSASTAAAAWPLSHHENDGKSKYGASRDLVGYASHAPNPKWPKGAKVCLLSIATVSVVGFSTRPAHFNWLFISDVNE